MDSEGMGSEFFRQFDWEKFSITQMTPELQEKLEQPLVNFFMSHTKVELYEGATKRGVKLYPVFTPRELVESPQLKARDFWIELEHPELPATITYPGPFIKLSETPVSTRRRAPLIGEHNHEIYTELVLTTQELIQLKEGDII